MYKENITENLDVIVDHMQYKQSSEFSETHREESEISEFSRAYKTDYEAARISTEHNYTELRANPDHPYLTRQGGRTPNSYNEEETNEQLNDEHFKEFTFTQSCSADYETQENSGSIISDNYWAILSEESTDEDLEPHGGLRESTSRSTEENCYFNMIQPLKSRKHENRKNSNSCFSVSPWAILDHPQTTRQGRTDTDDSKDCSSESKAEQYKDKENSETHLKKTQEYSSTLESCQMQEDTSCTRGTFYLTWERKDWRSRYHKYWKAPASHRQ